MIPKWVQNWTAGENTHYRQIVHDVLAFRYGHESEPDWFVKAVEEGKIKLGNGKLEVNDGGQTFFGWPGDWVIATSIGKLVILHHDDFIERYEPKDKYAKAVA